VGRQQLHVERAEAVGGQHLLHRHQRQVRVVLVIDGVELHQLDELEQVREFEGDDAFVLQRLGEARRRSR
jgi:hypothetical protein